MTASCAPTRRRCSGWRSTRSMRWSSTISTAGFHGDKRRQRLREAARSTAASRRCEELKKAGRYQGLRHGHQHRRGARDRRDARSTSISASSPCPTRCSTRASLHRGMASLPEARRLGDHRRAVRLGHPRDRLGAGARTTPTARRPPEVQAKVRGIEAVCKAHNVALPAAALQFVLAHPIVVSVIPGAAKAERGDAERRLAERADPGRLLVRPQGAEADRSRFAGSGGTLSMVEAVPLPPTCR